MPAAEPGAPLRPSGRAAAAGGTPIGTGAAPRPDHAARPAALVSPHAPSALAAHACQGESNECGPHAAAMLIAALAPLAARTPEALAQALNRPRPRAVLGLLPLVRRVPGWATFPWGIVDLLRQAGVPARWRALSSTDALLATLVRGGLAAPVFGGWRPRPWAHVAVLVAWDPARGWGFADSLTATPEIRWRDHARFRRQWAALGRLVVIAHPPASPEETAR